MTKGHVIAAIATAMLTTLAIAGTASAQYPTPRGNLVCTTAVDVSVGKGTLTATLTDSTGKPVSGQPIAFKITSGGGSLSAYSVTTNGQGAATVTLQGADNTAVSASYDGLECRAVAQVLGTTFRPPSTGDAGLAGSAGSSDTMVLVACLAVMGLSGIGLIVLRGRRLAEARNR